MPPKPRIEIKSGKKILNSLKLKNQVMEKCELCEMTRKEIDLEFSMIIKPFMLAMNIYTELVYDPNNKECAL